MNNKLLYTIGYAGKTKEDFLKILLDNGIDCIVDVRTSPYSSAFPEFNREQIKDELKKMGIFYLYFGDGFGARRIENNVFIKRFDLNGCLHEQVDFSEVYKTKVFNDSVSRIEDGLKKGHRICLMCSEKDPFNCHRFWMVSYYFLTNKNGYKITNLIDKDHIVDISIDNIDPLNSCFESLEKEKTKFYKNHPEIDQISLFPIELEKQTKWWDDFYKKDLKSLEVLQLFNNIRIGYIKGDNEND